MDSLQSNPATDILNIEYQKKRDSIQPKIDKLLNWDLSRVRAYLINREGIEPEDADNRILEYKKFLCLSLLNKRPKPVSIPVDIVWHSHILFTSDYVKMSEEIFGRYFHHNPTVSESECRDLRREYYENTLATYKVMFGIPDETYWPQNSQVCLESVCSDSPYPDPPEQKSELVLN